jgi:hypothetical protein
MMNMPKRLVSNRCHLPIAICLLFCSFLLFAASGCAVLGVAAHALPPPTIEASYQGLAGQSCAVMVWADRGLRIDYPSIQLDAAASLQNKLKLAKAMKDTTWPLDPRSIVRYQLDHPEVDVMSITDVAPRLGVSRLIYVEIERFSTRSDESMQLYRGSIMATIKVVEVNDGVGTVAFEENSVQAKFPPNVPDEGYPKGNDYQFYLGTINAFSDEAIKRFVPYQEER